MKFNKIWVSLIIIFVLALFLRFGFMGKVPPSLNWDEASLGYNAYSILKSGKDEWGRFLPLSFEAFGDYKLPGYIYTDVLFIALFGLSETGIRLPSILSGIISILLIFLIVSKLTNDRRWAVISAFLFAISPWQVFLSRIALEANLALMFFLLATYFFLAGLKNFKYLSFSSIFFGICMFTYNSARVFIPLFVLAVALSYRTQLLKQKTRLVIPVVIFAIFLGLSSYLAIFQDSSSRYFWVQIVDQGAVNYLNQSRVSSDLPVILTKLVYNRYIYFAENFITGYLSHFSAQFLFLEGGSNYQFSLPGKGLLYLIELPFLVFGIIGILKRKSLRWFLLAWLLIAPLPAALTRESPHALRSIFMLGSLQIITGLGIRDFMEYLKSKVSVFWISVGFVLLGIFLFSGFSYFYSYFMVYPKQYSESWQYGIKQAYQYLASLPEYKSENIYVTKKYGEPHIFYLVYTRYDPLNYQNNPSLMRYSRSNWRWVDRLDNIYFVNDWEIKNQVTRDKIQGTSVLITSPGNFPENGQLIKTIYFLDGSKAFDVVKI